MTGDGRASHPSPWLVVRRLTFANHPTSKFPAAARLECLLLDEVRILPAVFKASSPTAEVPPAIDLSLHHHQSQHDMRSPRETQEIVEMLRTNLLVSMVSKKGRWWLRT